MYPSCISEFVAACRIDHWLHRPEEKDFKFRPVFEVGSATFTASYSAPPIALLPLTCAVVVVP